MTVDRQQIEDYVWDNFFMRFHCPDHSEESLKRFCKNHVTIPETMGSYFREDPVDFPPYVQVEAYETRYPLLFPAADFTGPRWHRAAGKVVFHYDPFAAIFYFLSGWQEYNAGPEKCDKLGRFKLAASFQYHTDCVDEPVVDYCYGDLLAAISAQGITIIDKCHQPSVFLTHDIDNLVGWKEDLLYAGKRLMFISALRILWKRLLNQPDEWSNLLDMARLEMKYGVRSTCFFLTTRERVDGIANADYDIHSEYLQQTLAFLREHEFGLGLHGSIGTFCDPEKLNREKERLDKKVVGHRFHFLHFSLGECIRTIQQCGLSYDSSFGWAESAGFRMGTCHPFHPFDLETGTPARFVEIPLILMDTSLRHTRYSGYSPAEAGIEIGRVWEKVKKVNGVFTVLWHNNYFTHVKYRGWGTLYSKMIEGFRSSGAKFHGSGENVLKKYLGWNVSIAIFGFRLLWVL